MRNSSAQVGKRSFHRLPSEIVSARRSLVFRLQVNLLHAYPWGIFLLCAFANALTKITSRLAVFRIVFSTPPPELRQKYANRQIHRQLRTFSHAFAPSLVKMRCSLHTKRGKFPKQKRWQVTIPSFVVPHTTQLVPRFADLHLFIFFAGSSQYSAANTNAAELSAVFLLLLSRALARLAQ